MRAGDLLRQLDQLLLPRLAAALTRLGQAPFHGALLRWTAVLSCTAVLSTAVLATERPLAPDLAIGEVTRVGVIDGDSISRYERAAARDLAALEGNGKSGEDTYALVSLTEYRTPQSLAALVGDARVAAVVSRVPLPERQTEIVRITAERLPEDVLVGMVDLAERKEREAADYRFRAAALGGGGPQERELRQLYESGARISTQEAAAYRAGCACVYAVVVRAPTTTLRGVAARPGVRVVDPAPEVRRLEGAVFTPPLPEQRDVVRPPIDRDLTPAPAPSVTTGSPSPAPVPEERVPVEPEVTDSSPAPAVTAPGPSPSTSLTPSTSTDSVVTSEPHPPS